jgi:eukaryotic-like serine/threonine-protein kinase
MWWIVAFVAGASLTVLATAITLAAGWLRPAPGVADRAAPPASASPAPLAVPAPSLVGTAGHGPLAVPAPSLVGTAGHGPPADVGFAPADPAAFVRTYYALLPGDTAGAWPLLSPAAQTASGGRSAYDRFYGQISQVSLDGVRTAGTATVEAVVVFVRTDGRTSREPYRFLVSVVGGRTVIDSFARL